jgi:HK97 family phage prohead protease
MTANLEYRTTPQVGSRSASVRASDTGKTLTGYSILWGVLSQPLSKRGDFFQERIQRGSTLKSLKDNDIFMLYSHDVADLLGRTSSETLQLNEDAMGLRFSLNVPDTNLGRDVVELCRRGDLKGMSFGFFIPKDGEQWTYENGERIRTVTQMFLHEISVVANPAYPTTSVQARTKIDHKSPNAFAMARQTLVEQEIEWEHLCRN